MCGIAGIVTDVHHDVVEAMVQSLIHRGPDGHGSYKDDHIALGQRRLSIIDIVLPLLSAWFGEQRPEFKLPRTPEVCQVGILLCTSLPNGLYSGFILLPLRVVELILSPVPEHLNDAQ